MSMANDLLRAEGEATGESKAKVNTFLMLARSKFRRVPADRQEQVRTASMRQLDAWLRRILMATSLDAVFDGETRSGKRSTWL